MNIRETVVQTAKKAYADKLFAATSGNLSIYDRENGRMYITPGSYPYEIMTAEDIMVIDLDGNVLEGVHAPSSEWRMHAQVYRDMPEVRAIVHTHSPYATAFAINHLPIAAVSFEMPYFLGGDVPVARAALLGTYDVGINAVAVLKDRYACLLANHGVLTIGDSMDIAYTRAVYVEDAAKVYSIALTHGPVHVIDSATVDKLAGR